MASPVPSPIRLARGKVLRESAYVCYKRHILLLSDYRPLLRAHELFHFSPLTLFSSIIAAINHQAFCACQGRSNGGCNGGCNGGRNSSVTRRQYGVVHEHQHPGRSMAFELP